MYVKSILSTKDFQFILLPSDIFGLTCSSFFFSNLWIYFQSFASFKVHFIVAAELPKRALGGELNQEDRRNALGN
jgi:hypothetical protein